MLEKSVGFGHGYSERKINMKIKDILVLAKSYVNTPKKWYQGQNYDFEKPYSILQAICAASGTRSLKIERLGNKYQNENALSVFMEANDIDMRHGDIYDWNNDLESHKELMEAFDKAIKFAGGRVTKAVVKSNIGKVDNDEIVRPLTIKLPGWSKKMEKYLKDNPRCECCMWASGYMNNPYASAQPSKKVVVGEHPHGELMVRAMCNACASMCNPKSHWGRELGMTQHKVLKPTKK